MITGYLTDLGRYRVVCARHGRVGRGGVIFATSRRVYVWAVFQHALEHAEAFHDDALPAIELVNDPGLLEFERAVA